MYIVMDEVKGIILAAGYGTRFLPVTKVIPKELLPIIDRPALDFIIDEFIASGITNILIIISPHKKLIMDYYRVSPWLERFLTKKKRTDLLEKISVPAAHIQFAFQEHMHGTGHALLQAQEFVGTSTAIVAYPDDLHIGDTPLSAQLIKVFRTHNKSILAALEITNNAERYGMLKVDSDTNMVHDIIEKPASHQIPSNYASIGRFLLKAEFFEHLAQGWQKFDVDSGQEYYHVHALKKLMAQQEVVYHVMRGTRLDIGEPHEYAKAIAHFQSLAMRSEHTAHHV